LLAPFVPFLSEALYRNLVAGVVAGEPASVHLSEYPIVNDELVDSELLEAMSAAQRVVALGRAARDKVGLKNRQPLARIFVRAPSAEARDRVMEMQDIILDELNVKKLQFAEADDELVSYSVRPNLPALGPRYGKQMPAIRAALASLDPAEVVRLLTRNDRVILRLDGQVLELGPDEIVTSATERLGYAAMAADGFLVALDTELTPELRREGLARQVVRRVNEWRKAAGFSIEDRILVRYQASNDLAHSIQEFVDHIQQETLAKSFIEAPPSGSGFHANARFEGEELQIELERV
jgi:isoleucyl-tRNA synthetase